MSKKIGYYIKAAGDSIDEIVYFDEDFAVCNMLAYEDFAVCNMLAYEYWAKEAMEHAYESEDSEYIHDGNTITLVIDGKEIGDFEITIENAPVFSAKMVK